MYHSNQHQPRAGGRNALRWLAILSLSGLFSLLLASPSVLADSDDMSISISPSKVSVNVGATVTLTATVRYVEDNDPVPGKKVLCTIKGVHTLKDGVVSAVTDSHGRATFSYTGIHDGTDTVSVVLDLNNNGAIDTSEPVAAAQITWVAPQLVLTPPSQTVTVGKNAPITVTLAGHLGELIIFHYVVVGANPTSGNVVSEPETPNPTINLNGNNAGTDTVTVFPDFNNNGKQDPNEPSASATIQRVVRPTLVLTPATQDADTKSSANVKATLLSGYTPVSGVTIRFTSVGANGSSGAHTTNASGDATYTSTGTEVGTETVTAFADLNNNGQLDEGEPTATASAQINWHEQTTVEQPPLPPADVLKAAQPAAPQVGCDFYPETQHNVCSDTWGDAWLNWGTLGAAFLGYPITEPFQENGRTVQYTERARVEVHEDLEPLSYNPRTGPASYEVASPKVLFGLLGDEVSAGRGSEPPFQPTTANPSGDCTFYAETGHNLCGGFLAYWQKYGGLAINGFPISEEFQEVNPDTGKTYTVQYFERERYEWHPGEWAERFDVELGRLGVQVFSMKYGTKYA